MASNVAVGVPIMPGLMRIRLRQLLSWHCPAINAGEVAMIGRKRSLLRVTQLEVFCNRHFAVHNQIKDFSTTNTIMVAT